MRSLSTDAGAQAGPESEAVFRILDLAFGFFVWAIHLLVVYVATAIYCVLHPGAAETGIPPMFLAALVVITIAAAAAVLGHAGLRYLRKLKAPHVDGFRLAVTVGCDAIAAVAIVLLLFPIRLVPACA